MGLALAFAAGAIAGGVGMAVVARRRADETRRLYGRLFSFGMHELNTPVTAVNMTVVNLMTGVFGDVPAAQLKWVELARDQVGRAAALVSEMRDLVHLELHRDMAASVGDASPAELVDEALSTLRRGFEQAGTELRVEGLSGLPRVRTDPERAARSLSSLVFHARKFRVDGPVAVRGARRDRMVALEVEYRGAVLRPGEARESLDLFYPARRRSDHLLAATGLGLGLVRAVARRMGGDLEFAVDGAGRSRLTLLLPVQEAA